MRGVISGGHTMADYCTPQAKMSKDSGMGWIASPKKIWKRLETWALQGADCSEEESL